MTDFNWYPQPLVDLQFVCSGSYGCGKQYSGMQVTQQQVDEHIALDREYPIPVLCSQCNPSDQDE